MADVLTTRELVKLCPRPTLAQIRRLNPAVSTISRWRQLVWHLDHEQDGLGAAVFDFRQTPASYRNVAKMMVWLGLGGVGGLAARKVSTMVAIPERLHKVFAFMHVCAGRLDRLVPAHFDFFLGALRDGYRVVNGVGPPEYPVRMILSVWRDLHAQARAFAAAGMPSLSFDPFMRAPLAEVLASFACRDTDKREALPDEIAALLFVEAEKWVERAQDLISLQNRILHLFAENGGSAMPEMLSEIRRGPYRREGGGPWHVVPRSVISPAQAVLHLRFLIGTLEGAMSHLVLHEIGLRPSEFVSPAGGFNEASGLPACVERVPVPDEGVDLYLLHGTLFKTERTGVPEVWVAGTTASDADLPPPAVRALEVLEWIHAPWRGNSDKLLVSFNLHTDQAAREGSIGPVRMRKVRGHLRRFYETADWSVLAPTEALAAEIVKTRGGNIVPANMRKGVSNYFVRLDSRLLEPVSNQLKHDTVEETEIDYVTDDPTLMEPAREFASMEVARLMLKSSGAIHKGAHGLPATHLPHLADIAALRAKCTGAELLDAVNRIVVERNLSQPRTPIAQSVQPTVADRADALLDQYRVTRTIWLNATSVGRRREYASFRERAERIVTRLAEIGIDPPTDEELRNAHVY